MTLRRVHMPPARRTTVHDMQLTPLPHAHLLADGEHRKMKLVITSVIVGSLFAACTGEPTARASHILVKERTTALQLLKLLRGGADFAKLARKHSLCPSKSQGGDLGSFSPGQMVPQFDAAIFNPKSQLNSVLGPVQTEFGFHLIVLTERRGVSSHMEVR